MAKSVVLVMSSGYMWRTHLSSTGWFHQTKRADVATELDISFLHKAGPKSDRLKIVLGDGQEWAYTDGRSWGKFHLVKGTKPELDPYMASFGPDWLTDPDAAETALLMHRGNRRVKDVLCDQHLTSGIGNYLACEALFLAKEHPHTRWKELGPTTIARLAASIKQVVKEAMDARDVAHWRVFKRAGKHCVHGNEAQADFHKVSYVKDPGDQRGSYFCPICQGVPTGMKVVPNPEKADPSAIFKD